MCVRERKLNIYRLKQTFEGINIKMYMSSDTLPVSMCVHLQSWVWVHGFKSPQNGPLQGEPSWMTGHGDPIGFIVYKLLSVIIIDTLSLQIALCLYRYLCWSLLPSYFHAHFPNKRVPESPELELKFKYCYVWLEFLTL